MMYVIGIKRSKLELIELLEEAIALYKMPADTFLQLSVASAIAIKNVPIKRRITLYRLDNDRLREINERIYDIYTDYDSAVRMIVLVSIAGALLRRHISDNLITIDDIDELYVRTNLSKGILYVEKVSSHTSHVRQSL